MVAHFTKEDVQIIDNAVDIIRRNPHMFLRGFPAPTGELLASYMAGDLIWLRATPARVDYKDGWWMIHSARDWLAEIGDRAFSQIVPMPEAGRIPATPKSFSSHSPTRS